MLSAGVCELLSCCSKSRSMFLKWLQNVIQCIALLLACDGTVLGKRLMRERTYAVVQLYSCALTSKLQSFISLI